MSAGIYRIVHRATGMSYVGGTSRDVNKRLTEHRSRLKRGLHSNHALQAAWREHGPSAFDCLHIETVIDRQQITAREQFWLDQLQPLVFNCGPSVDRPQLGRKLPWTPERRAAYVVSDKRRAEMRAYALTRTYSESTRLKMSESAKNRGRRHLPQSASIGAGLAQ